MKKIFVIFFLCCGSCFAQSGWQYQNSGVNNNLVAVDFANPDLGITVGGVILRTANGGTTWEQIPLPQGYTTPPVLYSVVFFDNTTALIYAKGKYVESSDTSEYQFLRSTDAGLTWQILPRPKEFKGVYKTLQKISPSIAFFAENPITESTSFDPKGYIIKTTDAGLTWSRVDSAELTSNQTYYTGLSVADEERWISSKYVSQEPALIYSAELHIGNVKREFSGRPNLSAGGQQAQNLPIIDLAYAGGNNWLVYCDTLGEGIGERGLSMYRSNDNGLSWNSISVLFPEPSTSGGAFHARYNNTLYYYFSGVKYYDYKLQRTNDAGTSWLKKKYPMDLPQLIAIAAVTDRIAYAVGANGTIIKTTDGGGVTSVEDFKENSDFVLYPNPASDYITIESPKIQSNIIITNNLGQEVYRSKADGEKININVSQFPAGAYTLRCGSQAARMIVIVR